tara:strand:+ start:5895 stop:6635 length:741 start_codon:yes stop_codon:yes gene_type:complete
MSLTYPVLNDIYAVKINELNSFIDLVDEKLVGNQTELNSKLDNVTSQVNNQNIKIDLIHNLFNQYKASTDKDFNHKDYEILKSSQMNLINSIRNEYSQIVSSVKNTVHVSNTRLIEQVDKKIESMGSISINSNLNDRINKIEFAINKLTEVVNSDLKSNVHNINTEFANLNFRLNGLESKYLGLIKKLSLINTSSKSSTNIRTYDSDEESCGNCNDTSSMDNEPGTHNWVKVTKKHKNKPKYPSGY